MTSRVLPALAVTLLDLKRHPLYHVWELLFSGAYAMVAGPFLAQTAVAPLFGRLGIGSRRRCESRTSIRATPRWTSSC